MRQLTDSEMAHRNAGWRRYKSEYETEPTHIWPFEHGFIGGLDTAAEYILSLEGQVAALQADNERLRTALAEIAAHNPNSLIGRRLVEIARQALDNPTT